MRSTRMSSRSRPGKSSRHKARELGDVPEHVPAPAHRGGFYASGPALGLGPVGAAPLSPAAPAVQRFTDDPTAPMPDTVSTDAAEGVASAPASAAVAPVAAAPAATQDLLVEDMAATLEPGQMRRSDFLAQLRAALEVSVSDVSAIDSWFAYYGGQGSRQIEQALHRSVPGTAGARTAQEYIPQVVARAQQAERQDSVAGIASRVGEAVAGIAEEAEGLFFKGASGGARAPVSAAGVQSQLGSGGTLDASVGSTVGSVLGEDFSGVRVHTDERAARLSRDMNARAFTVGTDVAFGPGEYRPGTPVGDALIAHELAHVAQQKAGALSGMGSRDAAPESDMLEREADHSAAGATLAIWGGSAGAQDHAPGLRSALALQRCSRRAPEPSLFQRLSAVTDERDLARSLEGLDASQMHQIQGMAPAGSRLGDGIRWELAVRNNGWSEALTLHRAGRFQFQPVYGPRVVERIMAGHTNIHITSTDRTFRDWAETRFRELAEGRTGFLLILDLLAAGQPINITGTEGENATEAARVGLGRFVSANDSGVALPIEAQHPGTPTGSNISYNPTQMQNSVTLGGTPGHASLIPTEETVTFGHELIHALHNARGENIAPTMADVQTHNFLGNTHGYVRDPMTGRERSAEEIRTISGERSFDPPTEGVHGPVNWALRYNLVADGNITENMLRRERNLPDRSSHEGATRGTRLPVRRGETVQQMLGRYSLPAGAIPEVIAAALHALLLELNPYLLNLGPNGMPMDIQVWFPHPNAVAMYVSYVSNRPDLRDAAASLRVQ